MQRLQKPLNTMRRLRPEQWRSMTALAALWVVTAAFALWFLLPAGRSWSGQSLGLVLMANPDAILWARAFNVMTAGLVAVRAVRARSVMDFLTAVGFAYVLLWHGAGQSEQGVPLTAGYAAFTAFNSLICWRWADGLHDRAETLREEHHDHP